MLHLRLLSHHAGAESLERSLDELAGVRRIARAPAAGTGDLHVITADVEPGEADGLMMALRERGVGSDDYLLTRIDVVAPVAPGAAGLARRTDVSWVEVLGHARANSRPLARYLALMAVAGVIAAMGVITSNTILIVGAMAVSPDLLPICATCVGIVGRRWDLAGRSFATLCVGLFLVAACAAALAALLNLVGLLGDGYQVGQGGVGSLVKADYSTVIISLAAGVAAMLSFETRAAAAVGVAISVTTIPASAYLGVSIGVGEQGYDALLTLVLYVTGLICSGTLTLAVQRVLERRRARPSGARAGRA